MTSKKAMQRSILASVVAIALCCTMMLGATWAWFTDTVVNTGNTIASGVWGGEVGLEVLNAEGTWVNANTSTSASTAPIFTCTDWKPGDSIARVIKVSNTGNIDLDWEAAVVETEDDGGLSDVIDVYYEWDVTENTTDITGWEYAGTLTACMTNNGLAAKLHGELTAHTEKTFGLALKFQEDADPRYSEKSVKFDFQVLATEVQPWTESATPDNLVVENGAVQTATNIAMTPTDDDAPVDAIAVTIPAGTKLTENATELKLTVTETEEVSSNISVMAGQETIAMEIKLEGLAEDNTQPITVSLTIEKGLSNVALYHKGKLIDSTYVSETGVLTFTTTNFSPFTIVHGEVPANADSITANGDSYCEPTVEGAVVTVKPEGAIKWLKSATGTWNNWVGFCINTPAGVDATKAVVTRPDGATRILANVLDNATQANFYWGLADKDSKIATYTIDWNADGHVDLTVVIDATEAELLPAPHAGAISANGDSYCAPVASEDGKTVTIKPEGEIKWRESATDVWNNWVGFCINTPAGVDATKAVVTRPDGETRILANVLDNATQANFYCGFADKEDKVATYTIDWNGDGVVDLTVVIDATEATLELEPFKVTFVGFEGADLGTLTVGKGTAATAPTAPTVEGYTFKGWDKEFDNVTENLTVTAIYKINTYTITFLDGDGSVLDTMELEYGSGISAPSENPTKAATNEYEYVFDGWKLEGVTVKGNDTITPTFTAVPKLYTITWTVNGTEHKTEKLTYGAAITAPEYDVPENTDYYTYTFSGWTVEEGATVTGNATFDATLTQTEIFYTITWLLNGEKYHEDTWVYGAPIVAPEYEVPTNDAQFSYAFQTWNVAEGATVTGNATYEATLTKTVNKYNVTWNVNGTTTTEAYEYGATPVHADPTKVGNAQYTYTFAGWTPAITSVTGDATYTAQFDATVNTYTVTFKDWNNGTISTQQVAYGSSASAPTAGSRLGYTFKGWDKDFSQVTSDMRVYAQYDRVIVTGAATAPSEGFAAGSFDGGVNGVAPTGPIAGAPFFNNAADSCHAKHSGFTVGDDGKLIVKGWVLCPDGQDGLFFSFDNRTWYAFDGGAYWAAEPGVLLTYNNLGGANTTINNYTNGRFNVSADLSAYAGKTIPNIYVALRTSNGKMLRILDLTNVSVPSSTTGAVNMANTSATVTAASQMHFAGVVGPRVPANDTTGQVGGINTNNSNIIKNTDYVNVVIGGYVSFGTVNLDNYNTVTLLVALCADRAETTGWLTDAAGNRISDQVTFSNTIDGDSYRTLKLVTFTFASSYNGEVRFTVANEAHIIAVAGAAFK